MAFTSLNPAAGVAIDRRWLHFIVHHTMKKEMLSGVELTNKIRTIKYRSDFSFGATTLRWSENEYRMTFAAQLQLKNITFCFSVLR